MVVAATPVELARTLVTGLSKAKKVAKDDVLYGKRTPQWISTLDISRK